MYKLICVIGATGNQGGSVARRFLKDPEYHVRGITRNPHSPAAQQLAEVGVEIVQADLDDVKSLESAFAGAHVIFSVTNFWEPFFRPDCRTNAQELGISCNKYAYNVELQQGKNIADAVATTIDSLASNGFLVSTLSHARKCSGGAFQEAYHFDAKADVFPYYVQEHYPALAKKMSCIQTGFFTSSYKLLPTAYLAKVWLPDDSFQMSFTTDPDKPVPHLAVNADTGNFVYAVAKMPPGKQYMAEGSTCSWSEYIRIWGKVTGMKVSYKQITSDELVAVVPDKAFGREVADMFSYSSDPGYDGGVNLLTARDIRDAGIDCPMTSLEDWMKEEDWNAILINE
ncbi:NAD(P)-binding protein [Rhizodiscina lignyota]|uniref:NAD(P)-binding protein n=1 Tax=Rhizodiscina lignyota TaxID=1504668 RepID=A0A9P4IN33_9PEZI|nr:NAD(P)-binding protein [Rhizodiscina lignyota]